MHIRIGTVRTVRITSLPGGTRLWNVVGLAARLLLAVVFLISGIAKAADPAQTKVAVKAYQLLPDSLAETVAAILPYLEIAVAIILLLGLATRLGALLSGLMMVAFLIGVTSAAARGLSIDCGCFGGGGTVQTGATEYTLEILRDTGLLIVSVYLLLRPRTWLAVDSLAHRDRGGDDDGAGSDENDYDAQDDEAGLAGDGAVQARDGAAGGVGTPVDAPAHRG